jgi:hypothetical protein
MPESENVRSYKDLEVWQLAKTLAVACYQVTETFPARKHSD